MNGVLRKAIETGDTPEVVAKTILEAATASAPRRRYAAGKMARQVSLLRRVGPEFAFDKSLRKQNGYPSDGRTSHEDRNHRRRKHRG